MTRWAHRQIHIAPLLIEQLLEGTERGRVARDGLGDRLLKLDSGHRVEKSHETRGDVAQVCAALSGAREERFSTGYCARPALESTLFAREALGTHRVLHVTVVFDLVAGANGSLLVEVVQVAPRTGSKGAVAD
jgi:hypothetical protein